jgi:hypothetical protein
VPTLMTCVPRWSRIGRRAVPGTRARAGLERWHREVEQSGIGEFAGLARTVKAWEPGLLAHFDSGATNGATEGITNLIKVVKRQGFGYRNFENFPLRVLYPLRLKGPPDETGPIRLGSPSTRLPNGALRASHGPVCRRPWHRVGRAAQPDR